MINGLRLSCSSRRLRHKPNPSSLRTLQGRTYRGPLATVTRRRDSALDGELDKVRDGRSFSREADLHDGDSEDLLGAPRGSKMASLGQKRRRFR
jgi:hypothetical protein